MFPRRAGGVGTGAQDALYCWWRGGGQRKDNPCLERVIHWALLSRTLDPVLPPSKRAPTAHNTLFFKQWAAAKVGALAACCVAGARASLTRTPPRARARASQAKAPPRPPRALDPEGWSLYEGLLPLEERQLRTAPEFVAAAQQFSRQPLLWVGAPVRVEDAASFAPSLLPDGFEAFRLRCRWPADGFDPARTYDADELY